MVAQESLDVRVALYVQPVATAAEPRLIPIAKGVQAGELHFAKILGQ